MNRLSPKLRRTLHTFLGYPLYWVCQLGGWGSILAITWFPRPPASYADSACFFLCLLFLSHVYRVYIRLNGWSALEWKSILPRALVTCFCISLSEATIGLLYFPGAFTRPDDTVNTPHPHLFGLTVVNFFLMAAWSGIYFGYHFHVRYQQIQVNHLRLQVALREAEHRALSAQINPHFLFNSLNTLRSLVEENPEKAREGLTELACMFRASLKTTRKNLIPLKEELETVRSYLSLEQIRFEHRLVVRGDIPAETLDAMLPPFLLQTLIENAIKYGMGPRPQAEILYRAYLDDQGLRLQVTNPGQVEVPRKGDSSSGIGLENSRLRLHLLFGSKAFLNLSSLETDSVLAEALIPQRRGVA